MEVKDRIIGVIGGMGPETTNDLLRKILKNTKAQTDQEHIHLIIDDNTKIPDRTDLYRIKRKKCFFWNSKILKDA